MSDTGWTTVGTLPPGSLFETREGEWWEKLAPGPNGEARAVRIWYTEDDARVVPADCPAHPLTPVAVSPSLPADLKALLLGALATGETDVLEDYLLDRRADPDVRRAVRDNCVRVCDRVAGEFERQGAGLACHVARECGTRILEDESAVRANCAPSAFT
jgi:hypothetical protein